MGACSVCADRLRAIDAPGARRATLGKPSDPHCARARRLLAVEPFRPPAIERLSSQARIRPPHPAHKPQHH
ncbi:hypothetical protein FE789_09825 [Burkholderia pseudomallei]|nr:hypothetical protein BOC43_17140 [Burkholderia pseudomallei]PNW98742.1 hypothetical protein CF649_25715 [Burkholderia sp. 136(2017)]PNX14552.1 hypothetical protein CF650_14565 [Burkholderia sp. 129]PNX25148.1 hypothetical protein CF647_32155 [Burkholderia sp. 117]PNX35132.1 hypothetical protein CF648_25720 [Burkholderia sp. 137]